MLLSHCSLPRNFIGMFQYVKSPMSHSAEPSSLSFFPTVPTRVRSSLSLSCKQISSTSIVSVWVDRSRARFHSAWENSLASLDALRCGCRRWLLGRSILTEEELRCPYQSNQTLEWCSDFSLFRKDADGITALHLCAYFNCTATCDTLCARQAFVNAKDNQLLTPLFYACKANCPVRTIRWRLSCHWSPLFVRRSLESWLIMVLIVIRKINIGKHRCMSVHCPRMLHVGLLLSITWPMEILPINRDWPLFITR